jgi:hypothetical protein
MEVDLREIDWDGIHWIQLASSRDQYQAIVNTVLYCRVHAKLENSSEA